MTALLLAVAMLGGTTIAPATIDVRVLTKEHPTQLTFEGPRRGAAALTGGELQVNGVTVSMPANRNGPKRSPKTMLEAAEPTNGTSNAKGTTCAAV